jgi:crotonobetainyl-CoA:carnitine CoA-transferase CaiB-like acyl-CoA transferase
MMCDGYCLLCRRETCPIDARAEWREKHREELRAYNREWMRRKRRAELEAECAACGHPLREDETA